MTSNENPDRQTTLNKALQNAAKKGDLLSCKEYVKLGADINDFQPTGVSPLEHAVENEDLELLQWLIENHVDVTDNIDVGESYLHTAASKCNTEFCRVLIKCGIPVNCIDEKGFTPLMCVDYHHRNALKVIDLLIQEGADLNIVGDWQKGTHGEGIFEVTALDLAYGNKTIFEYLRERGATEATLCHPMAISEREILRKKLDNNHK